MSKPSLYDTLRKARANAEIAQQCNALSTAYLRQVGRDLLIADLERINRARQADKQDGFYPIPELIHAEVETTLNRIAAQPRSKPTKGAK